MNAPEPLPPSRTTYIGGSDIPAVLGVSPYCTPVELYMRKRTGSEIPDNAILRRGRMLEPYVRQLYGVETGRDVQGPRFVRGIEPWMGVNLDGSSGPDERVLECKTANQWTRKDWGDEGTDAIPVYYTAQVQWAMRITGFNAADVAALIGIDDFRVYRVEADIELQRRMIDLARDFWRRVQEGDPPAPRNAEDVYRLFPQHVPGASAEASADDCVALTEYQELKQRVKEIEIRIDQLRMQLTAKIGDAESLIYEGHTLATWKGQQSRRIDVELLRQTHPAIAAQFEKVGHTRVFRVK